MKKSRKKKSDNDGSGNKIPIKDLKKSIKYLVSLIWVYKWRMFFAVFLSIASSLFYVLGPKVMGLATDKLFEGVLKSLNGGPVNIDMKYIGMILLYVLGLYIVSSGFVYLQEVILAGVTSRISYNLRKQMLHKVNMTKISYYDTVSNGEILSRITNDVDNIGSSLTYIFTQLMTSVVTLVGIASIMISINWKFAIVAMVTIPISYITIKTTAKRSSKYFSKWQECLGNLNGYIEEMYTEHSIVQVFNAQEKSIAEFEDKSHKLGETSWRAQFISGITLPLIELIGNIGYIAMAILGGILVIKRAITVGDIQAFIQYIKTLNQPITQLANTSTTIQQALASSERVCEFLNQDEEIESKDMVNLPIDVRGDVEFRDVSFGYKEDQQIIKSLSLKVKSGDKIAIVGPTGSGKTTIVKLLLRFYDLDHGNILIDGIDIKKFPLKDLRSLFSMVLQDAWIYSGTIRDNIKYSNENADNNRIIEAAKAAYVDHFINTLPDGYDTVINEEATNISQGEKQLITIARAILSDSKILILDEATSSVDTRTESQIQKAMDNLMKNRTSFVIAHRLSTIRNADVILMIENGVIVESGNHNELLEKKGSYFKMYTSQFET